MQLSDDARLVSRELDSGKKRWKRDLGSLSASTPAIEDGRIYVTLLETSKGSGNGRIVCLRFRDGKILWSKTLSSRSRVLSAGAQRPRVLRLRGRHAVRARRQVGQAGLDLPRRRRDQGQPDAVRRRPPVLRRLRRLRARRAGARRGEDLEQERVRRAARRQLLRHRGGRLRARLHRRHRRPRLLALRQGRAHRLGAPDRPLRLLLRGRQERAGPRADGLLRLLRRHVLRARRPLGQGPLDPPLGRQDLRLADDRRRRRLLRRPRQGGDRRAEDRQRQGHVQVPDRRL